MQLDPCSTRQVREHPSPSLVLPSSQASMPFTMKPSPQMGTQRLPGTRHWKCESIVLQSDEHPSPLLLLPSSQVSLSASTPSPHLGGLQALPQSGQVHPDSIWQRRVQPSPSLVLLSSHSSPLSCFPLPQLPGMIGVSNFPASGNTALLPPEPLPFPFFPPDPLLAPDPVISGAETLAQPMLKASPRVAHVRRRRRYLVFMNSPLAWRVGGAGTIREAVGDTTRSNQGDPVVMNRRACVCAYGICWSIKLRGRPGTSDWGTWKSKPDYTAQQIARYIRRHCRLREGSWIEPPPFPPIGAQTR